MLQPFSALHCPTTPFRAHVHTPKSQLTVNVGKVARFSESSKICGPSKHPVLQAVCSTSLHLSSCISSIVADQDFLAVLFLTLTETLNGLIPGLKT